MSTNHINVTLNNPKNQNNSEACLHDMHSLLSYVQHLLQLSFVIHVL